MPPWTEVVGTDPAYWLEPLDTLPLAHHVLEHIRAGGHSKVVALVGYRDDAEASEASRRLPYGHRGEGIEEIVFSRQEPGDIVEFADDAWPGEDRTYVDDDVDSALARITRFAVEYGAAGSIVIVTGDVAFLDRVATTLAQADSS